MGKILGNIGSVILGVLILLLLLSIMVFIPAVILNYILLKLGSRLTMWEKKRTCNMKLIKRTKR